MRFINHHHLLAALCSGLLLAWVANSQAQSQGPLALVEGSSGGLLVIPTAGYDLSVTIVGNNRPYEGEAVQGGNYVGRDLADGLYKYALTILLPEPPQRALEGRERGTAGAESLPSAPTGPTMQTGSFRLVGGTVPAQIIER